MTARISARFTVEAIGPLLGFRPRFHRCSVVGSSQPIPVRTSTALVYPWRASADSAASTTRLRSLFGEPELIDSPFVENLL